MLWPVIADPAVSGYPEGEITVSPEVMQRNHPTSSDPDLAGARDRGRRRIYFDRICRQASSGLSNLPARQRNVIGCTAANNQKPHPQKRVGLDFSNQGICGIGPGPLVWEGMVPAFGLPNPTGPTLLAGSSYMPGPRICLAFCRNRGNHPRVSSCRSSSFSEGDRICLDRIGKEVPPANPIHRTNGSR